MFHWAGSHIYYYKHRIVEIWRTLSTLLLGDLLCSSWSLVFGITVRQLHMSRPICQMRKDIHHCTMRTVFWLTGQIYLVSSLWFRVPVTKKVSNLVYYSLLVLCTFVVLAKMAKDTGNIPLQFYTSLSLNTGRYQITVPVTIN